MHKSVLTNEVLDGLNIKQDGVYIDLTLGSGGHALKIFENLINGTLIVFEVDRDAIGLLLARFSEIDQLSTQINRIVVGPKQIIVVNRNFSRLSETLNELEIEKVDGVFADLGWSTDQLERIQGLSWKLDQELDMRLDPTLGVTAADLLNGLYERELSELFSKFADFYGNSAKELSKNIIEFRNIRPIKTTKDLLEIIDKALSFAPHTQVEKTYAGVFQALRIVVNNELSTLESLLSQTWKTLKIEGRLLVITFHSGEEKIVSSNLGNWVAEQKARSVFKTTYLRPSVEELTRNLRSRSAKLWGVEKTKE